MSGLTFEELRRADVARCEEVFHAEDGINGWTPADWATAMAGECGEACNEVKKLRRLQTSPNWNRLEDSDAGFIKDRIAAELADLVIYADLLAARLGIDLGEAIVEKFNVVSVRVGSTVRLNARRAA